MKRVYTIWPANRNALPSTEASDWHQSTRWLVLDVTDGISAGRVVEGPISRWDALRRELEIRAVDRASAKARRRTG